MYNAIIVGFDESFIRDVIYNLERGNCISIKKWFVSCKTIKEQAKRAIRKVIQGSMEAMDMSYTHWKSPR